VYEAHITAGQDKDASSREREVGAAVAAQLRRVIAPFFLRREKKDVLTAKRADGGDGGSAAATDLTTDVATSSSAANASGVSASASAARPAGLPHKNDLVVWLRLQPLQRSVYTAFLHSEPVKRALSETDSPLAALTVLKKICDHPALLSEAAASAVIAGGHK
jgi:SNF2 family DNA or RNA helicase